jgi:hypothetical protein
MLNHILYTVNCPDNYRDDRKHRLSLSSDETGSHIHSKCNCKKSKCLKLYCECFSQGKYVLSKDPFAITVTVNRARILKSSARSELERLTR